MTAFVVVACLVALSLGFVAGVIVGLVMAHRDARRGAAAAGVYCDGPHLFWRDCADCEHANEAHKAAVRRLWQ